MKKSEIIRKYRDTIAAEMVRLYKSVIESDGHIRYGIYIWDDGEIRILEDVQGGNSYYVPDSTETRVLSAVCVIDVGAGFDIWDYTESDKPEDDDEREQMRDEIIDYLVEGYEESVPDLLDEIIKDAEEYERYEEEDY